jgi:hypothetical protein
MDTDASHVIGEYLNDFESSTHFDNWTEVPVSGEKMEVWIHHEGKLLVCTMNRMEPKRKEWKPMLKKMNSSMLPLGD